MSNLLKLTLTQPSKNFVLWNCLFPSCNYRLSSKPINYNFLHFRFNFFQICCLKASRRIVEKQVDHFSSKLVSSTSPNKHKKATEQDKKKDLREFSCPRKSSKEKNLSRKKDIFEKAALEQSWLFFPRTTFVACWCFLRRPRHISLHLCCFPRKKDRWTFSASAALQQCSVSEIRSSAVILSV